MANLFNRFSSKDGQTIQEENQQNEQALAGLKKSIQTMKDSSAKVQTEIKNMDRTKIIEKTVSMDYDKIIKAVTAAGLFLKAAKVVSPSLVVLKDAAILYNQSEKEQTEKESDYIQYLTTRIDVEFLYQTILPIVSSIPYGNQIIGILEILRHKKQSIQE